MSTLALLASLALLPPVVTPAGPQDAESTAGRDAAFERMLTGARLVGSYTLDGEDPPRLHADAYTIESVTKLVDGTWQFVAAVEYGERSVPVAVSLPVHWAGDTPVLSVSDFAFPLLGTYSARVLFHGSRYVGVWSGTGYGGEMFGRIERAEAEGEEERSIPPKSLELPVEESAGEGHWPSFRGPAASGVAEGFPTAIEWDVESGKNVLWKAPVPGLAHSSPVIWGDRLFVTTAVRKEGEQELRVGLYGDIAPVEDESAFRFELHCLDKRTGQTLWTRLAWEGVPAIKRHTKGSHAASTPATDGERVVAFFGTEGLYAWDLEGEPLWQRDFGLLDSGYYVVPDAQWGFASSPVLADGKVIVQCDVQGQSFLAALDAATGKELWRTERDEVPGWGTPTVHVSEGRAQVVCNGYKHIGGYDLATGAELWKLAGGGDIPVPTPVVGGDMVFLTNAHGRMAPIYAIALDAEGTLTMDPDECEHVVWSDARRGNYMQTPLVYGEEIYFCNDAGILACYDLYTGEEIFRERLGGGRSGFTGSGVAADGKLYFTSEEGDVHVVQPGIFELLAVNSLGEEFMSTPAISEGVLYFRARRHLIAVSE